MKEKIAENINILGGFCGIRDIEDLSLDSLKDKYGIEQADVMVLFGGSIICGGDVLASAMKNGVAKKYVIVGGVGHTTEALCQKVHAAYPAVPTTGLSEAEVFNGYLETVYGLKADYLETRSTNCGNNITYLLKMLRDKNIDFKSIILCQDSTMQRRMDAGLRKYVSSDVTIINYAVYKALVGVRNSQLTYLSDIAGMWEIKKYVELLMGEIPRLSDNSDGYGPMGKNYIAHVDIPVEVIEAFEELRRINGINIREANPLYASDV
ncbi:YdcF family protein [Solibaculum mannosilyticum]|uniref:YdcF family protein n=1 Tax=Solibaculum mannosilyticum TaxID=2780922 RepID=UPI0007A87606|nr:hypothetical protein BN3661_01611 [Eubacteriaceae bacterium CHKCI005]